MSVLKEETKRQIRALLLSAPKGLTVLGIQNDFKSMLGKTLPFRELGYPTAEDLFRDIPDVVRVTCVGEEVVLRGISDKSTEHIERMVSRQKVSSKKTKPRRYNVKGAPAPGRARLPRTRAGDRTFRSNYPFRSYLPPWAWPRSYRPTTRYRAANLSDRWCTAATLPVVPGPGHGRPTTKPSLPARPMAMPMQEDIAIDVHHQNTPFGVTENNGVCDFGDYVGAQLSNLPDTEAKELLKLNIQRLLMNARVAESEMMKSKPQTAMTEKITPLLSLPLLPLPRPRLSFRHPRLPLPWLPFRHPLLPLPWLPFRRPRLPRLMLPRFPY